MKILKRIKTIAAPSGEKVATFKMKFPDMEFIITKVGDRRFDVNPNFDPHKMNKDLEKKFVAEIQKQLKKRPEYDDLEDYYKDSNVLGSTTGINIPYDYSLYFKKD